jgi:ubiquinone/menaquinone biosynthesis C-methylase UbiE
MMNRRDLFAASGAAAALTTLHATGRSAYAAGLEDAETLRGAIGLFERLPELNAESVLDFHTGYRVWMMKSLSRAQVMQAVKVLRQNGIDPADDAPLDTVVDLLTADPIVALDLHNWERTQEIMWAKIKQVYDARADHFLAELAAAEGKGPGTLDLRPDLAIPDYARYEIHIQPGGYVGDRFAGYIYYHGQNVVFPHGNYQDDLQVSWARAMPRPADGKVRRVLDQGCSAGQFTMVLKKLFPDAEVWGNDVAAPMLRYAHMRTVKHGLEVHYAQELSEESHFPDNHFDLITNNLLVHEMPAAKVRELLAESYRTLRPGGVYYPLDSYTGDQPRHTALSKYYAWRNYRWNHEVWWMEYYDLDIAQAMREAGFKVDENGPAGRTDTTRNVIGWKV